MRQRYPYGTTAENDALTLPDSHFSIDTEKKALRIHDGETPGGFEVAGEQVLDLDTSGPGPSTPVGGDTTTGFFGEVDGHNDFITYEGLASQIGLSAGDSQYNDESLWLKFVLDGTVLFVAKKPGRSALSWEDIYQAGAVYGSDDEGLYPSDGEVTQDAQVEIDGYTFRVRLLRGASSDPTETGESDYDHPDTYGSEWNRLLYPVHGGDHTDTDNPGSHDDPEAEAFGAWADYSDEDLVTHANFGNGSFSWCQETSQDSYPNKRVFRGRDGVAYYRRYLVGDGKEVRGWRPVLELLLPDS